MKAIGYNSLTPRTYWPLRNEKASQAGPVMFSGIQGNDSFQLTVDFPETIQNQFETLQKAWNLSADKVLKRGLVLLTMLSVYLDTESPSSHFVWVTRVPKQLPIFIQQKQIQHRTVATLSETTTPQAFSFSRKEIQTIEEIAQSLGRTPEELAMDTVTLLWEIGERQKQEPKGQLGISGASLHLLPRINLTH